MHVGMITYVEVSAAGWGCFVLAQLLQNLWRTGQMLHCAFCTGFLFHLVPWRRSLQWRKWAQEGLIWKTNWAFSSSSKPHLCRAGSKDMCCFFLSSWNQLETLVVFCQASGRLPEGTIEDMAFHFVEDANEEYEPLVVDTERIRMDPMGLLDFVIKSWYIFIGKMLNAFDFKHVHLWLVVPLYIYYIFSVLLGKLHTDMIRKA